MWTQSAVMSKCRSEKGVLESLVKLALVAGGLGALHLPDLRDGKEPLKKKECWLATP